MCFGYSSQMQARHTQGRSDGECRLGAFTLWVMMTLTTPKSSHPSVRRHVEDGKAAITASPGEMNIQSSRFRPVGNRWAIDFVSN